MSKRLIALLCAAIAVVAIAIRHLLSSVSAFRLVVLGFLFFTWTALCIQVRAA
jgi:hypothetical protein